ncbi:MAG: hypothetical protein ACREAD_03235 [Nitrosopumilaceae archaeon]
MQKRILLGSLIAAIIIATTITWSMAQTMNNGNGVCKQISSFQDVVRNSDLSKRLSNNDSSIYLASDGTIAYLYDNFVRYENNQQILDEFEDPDSWLVNGEEGKLHLTDDHIGGNGALLYNLDTSMPNITLSKNFLNLQNLTRWEKSGYITMWLNVQNSIGIDSVGIKFEDKDGNTRYYQSLQNVHTNVTNTFANEKEYPDILYPEGDSKTERWVDYQITEGWSYLFWRADNFTDNGSVNMAEIKKVSINVELNKQNPVSQEIIFDDLRIQDGLQKFSNPTHGIWYPPHGRPQYGVYDIDKAGDGTYELRLIDVRNTQYPSNGDHARMISTAPVPTDFALRVQFTFAHLKDPETQVKIPVPFGLPLPKIPINVGLRNNTYFRMTYDFEPDWDPGHDWFGTYLSLQYNKLGMASVWPIQRNVLQDQEPKSGSTIASTDFTAQNNIKYEMDMVVKGQTASATIYEVDGSCLNQKAEMIYTFDHPRHTERYPLAIESTGNVLTIIHNVEIISLDTNSTTALKQIF